MRRINTNRSGARLYLDDASYQKFRRNAQVEIYDTGITVAVSRGVAIAKSTGLVAARLRARPCGLWVMWSKSGAANLVVEADVALRRSWSRGRNCGTL